MNAREALYPTSAELDARGRLQRRRDLVAALVDDARKGGTVDEMRTRGLAIIEAHKASNGGAL